MPRNFHRKIIVLDNEFLPTDITGLQLWLDASDISTIFQDSTKTIISGNGDVIGAWEDKSGNGNDVIQGTTSLKPSYQTNVQHSNPIVRLDGTDDFLRVAALAGGLVAQPTTLFVVAKLSVSSATFQFLIGGSANPERQAIRKVQTSNLWEIFAGTAATSAVAVDTSFHIVSSVFNGASSLMRLDSTQIISGNVSTRSQTGLTIGGAFNDALVWNGDIAEVIFYNRELTTNKIATVESNLSSKWGISLA